MTENAEISNIGISVSSYNQSEEHAYLYLDTRNDQVKCGYALNNINPVELDLPLIKLAEKFSGKEKVSEITILNIATQYLKNRK